MKTIFLSEKPKRLRSVYTDTAPALKARTGITDEVYTRADVLATPECFRDVEFIFSTWGMPIFSKEEIRSIFPQLKCVFYAAGTVQKFARPFLSCGVKVFSAWAANAVPVAEFTVAEIILANKGFYSLSRLMKEEAHDAAKNLKAACLGNYGERVGLLGAGMIGSRVAEMLKAYRLSVCVFDPFLSDERAEALGVTRCSLDEIFSTCRVVSNHLANNEETRGMLGYQHFSRMLPNATFINTGRGAQVVEDDLVRVLTERPDVTAVLDVTMPEPPDAGHAFYRLPNCILTPHVAGSIGSETHRMADYMLEEFNRFTAGLPCRYEVTEKMLSTMA